MSAADQLNEYYPVEIKPDVDYEIHGALHRENRMLRWTGGLCGIGFAIAMIAVYVLSHRKPQTIIVRVSDVGKAEAIQYTSTEFTPNDADVRSNLSNWARLRYTRTPEALRRYYTQNYYFLSPDLARKSQSREAEKLEIAKIIAGQGVPSDYEWLGVKVRKLNTQKLADGTVGEGEASIDFNKIFPAAGGVEAHKEHWTASVNFVFNPQQGAERYVADPLFQVVNPLGVMITYFHEDKDGQ